MGLRYTKQKIFHFMDKVNSLPKSEIEIQPPLHIRLKPTNICNHKCDYCAYTKEGLQLGRDMLTTSFIPKDKMMEIVEDIIEMDVKAVTFSGGGEPFCYPYFLDVLKRLASSNVRFASLTNGSLLNGEIAEIFANSGTWIRVSIDGYDGESYSKIRSVPVGEFDKVIKNMYDFKKLGGQCLLGVSIVVDTVNADNIFDLITQIKDTGTDTVKVSPCIVSNDMGANNMYHEPLLDKVGEQLEKAVSTLADSTFEIFNAYGRLDDRFEKGYDWCPYVQVLPVIGADLNVYSCHDKAYNLKNGLLFSIKEKSFKEGWFESKDQFFNINPSRVCNHHCASNEINRLILGYLNADKEHMMFV